MLPGFQSHLQVVSFYARDAVSDDVVFRFRNSMPADESSSVQLDLHQFFVQSRRIYGLRPRTLDITAPQSLLAQLKLGDVSAESRSSTATSALEAGRSDFLSTSSNSQRQSMGNLNSGEDGVFLSDHAVRDRSTLGVNVDGASVSIGPGELKSFLMVMVTLNDKDLPVPGRSSQIPQRTQAREPHAPHVEDATEVPHPDKKDSVRDPRAPAPTVPLPVRVSSHEGLEKEDLRKKIEKDKKMIAVLENRVKRFKALIDDLSQDLKLMGDDDESEDKLEMVQELSKTEDQLEQASEQLEQRKGESRADEFTPNKYLILHYHSGAIREQTTACQARRETLRFESVRPRRQGMGSNFTRHGDRSRGYASSRLGIQLDSSSTLQHAQRCGARSHPLGWIQPCG